MEVLYSRCCGLDVHKRTVVACLRTGAEKEMRSFLTTTEQLRTMAMWLNEADCTHVAMESTGVYWKPVVNVLELSGMEYFVVNAKHIKAVPGRKTDVHDAEWICDLMRHGLLRGSLIPDRPRRELQELTRYRRALIHERTREVNRIHKVLEGANVKLGTVMTDMMGVSGRSMLEAIANGETDARVIADLAHPKLKANHDDIMRAVEGLIGEHQRTLLRTQLDHIDVLNTKVAGLEAEIDHRLGYADGVLRGLDTIPGVSKITAQEIVAAIGTDMSVFPTAGHLASWAKLCPGSNESGGRRKPAGTGQGNPYLRSTLAEAANAAVHTKDTYLRSQYHRIKLRRGPSRATIAVAHTILIAAYYIIRDGCDYSELGGDYFDRRRPEATARHLIRRLKQLGLVVTVHPAA